jgi:hypothetical protein
MGYLHINNLNRDERIWLFKECFALEKVHGTSAHIRFEYIAPDMEGKYLENLVFFSGGEKYMNFVKLFNEEKLRSKFKELGLFNCTIFGEAYGGKQQGMSETYGKELKFIAFDVKIGDNWLAVPQAEEICKALEIEFVHYVKILVEIGYLNGERDSDSVQAIRNGMGAGKMREGIVLRPLIELCDNRGDRIITKYKRPEFSERKSKADTTISEKINYTEINKIVDEWVTEMRLEQILGKLESYSIEDTGNVIKLMQEDVLREGQGEILISENNKDLLRAIGNRTAQIYKKRISNENLR